MTYGQPGGPVCTARTGLVQGERVGLDREHVSVNVSPVSLNVSTRRVPSLV
jgi:hypothetical protein